MAKPRVARYAAPSASSRRSSFPPNRYGPPVPTPAGMPRYRASIKRAEPRLNLLVHEVGAHQPDAAVDVVADAARRNDAAFGRIGGRNAADAEAVSPVDVGHGEAGHLNARQKRHVGHLLRRLIAANLLEQTLVWRRCALRPASRSCSSSESANSIRRSVRAVRCSLVLT